MEVAFPKRILNPTFFYSYFTVPTEETKQEPDIGKKGENIKTDTAIYCVTSPRAKLEFVAQRRRPCSLLRDLIGGLITLI
jgi:hypothetical protein